MEELEQSVTEDLKDGYYVQVMQVKDGKLVPLLIMRASSHHVGWAHTVPPRVSILSMAQETDEVEFKATGQRLFLDFSNLTNSLREIKSFLALMKKQGEQSTEQEPPQD